MISLSSSALSLGLNFSFMNEETRSLTGIHSPLSLPKAFGDADEQISRPFSGLHLNPAWPVSAGQASQQAPSTLEKAVQGLGQPLVLKPRKAVTVQPRSLISRNFSVTTLTGARSFSWVAGFPNCSPLGAQEACARAVQTPCRVGIECRLPGADVHCEARTCCFASCCSGR